MTDSVWSWTLADFRDRTASSSPTPGGGSVASVCAVFGLGLVLMGLEITRKGEEAEQATDLDLLLHSGHGLLTSLSTHADRDIAAFDQFMQALSLPKGTAEEKTVRREQMQKALTAATEAPLAAGRDISAALDLARQAADRCKLQILSDVIAGADLLSGSLAATLRNVDINLPGLSDLQLRERFQKERAEIAQSASQQIASIDAVSEARTRGE